MNNLFDFSIGKGLTPGGNRYVYNHHTNQQFNAPSDANTEQQHHWVRGFMAAIKRLEESFEFYPEHCLPQMHPEDIVEALREPALRECEPGRWDQDMLNDLIKNLQDLLQEMHEKEERRDAEPMGVAEDHVTYRWK